MGTAWDPGTITYLFEVWGQRGIQEPDGDRAEKNANHHEPDGWDFQEPAHGAHLLILSTFKAKGTN